MRLRNSASACYVACMHAWQPARQAAVLAQAERAGLTKSAIARIAGVHRSQLSRWFRGEQRPGYDAAMRIIGWLQQEQPQLADEFAAATGYGGPVEPEPEPSIPPEVLADIRRLYPPWKQDLAIEALEGLPTEPPGGEESGPGRSAG